jgi:hypothetical protein
MRICDKCGHREVHLSIEVEDQRYDLCLVHKRELLQWLMTREDAQDPLDDGATVDGGLAPLAVKRGPGRPRVRPL